MRLGIGSGRRRPTVVVIGGGFGGLATVVALRKAPVRTVLIDRHNYHLFAPLLYQVSTALLDPTEIAQPIRSLIRKVRNCEFRQADVVDIDLDERKVRTSRGPVRFDYLVIAAGSVTNFFGNREVEAHAVGMKDLSDAQSLRDEVLSRFEQAKWTTDHDQRRRLLSFVIVGGGPTGVETAGALAELVHHVLKKDYKALDVTDTKITLLEGSGTVLAPFHAKLRRAAHERLEQMGVAVLRHARVSEITDDGILLTNGNRLPPALVVWAAGVRGSDIAAAVPDAVTRQNRVKVNQHLQVIGHPNVFAVGDIADIQSPRGTLPMIAPVATQGGACAARNIMAHLNGTPLQRFRYKDKGMMATIGRNAAVVQVKGLRISGVPGWLTWMAVHVALISSFRSQVAILWNWLWHYPSHDRPARLILGPGVIGTHVGEGFSSNGSAPHHNGATADADAPVTAAVGR